MDYTLRYTMKKTDYILICALYMTLWKTKYHNIRKYIHLCHFFYLQVYIHDTEYVLLVYVQLLCGQTEKP